MTKKRRDIPMSRRFSPPREQKNIFYVTA